MSIQVKIQGLDIPDELYVKAQKITRRCIEEYTSDLLRVSSLRTPVKDGNLETSGTKKVKTTFTGATGIVSFKAINKGYNYAVKMHDGKYKLGKRSLEKSSGGVRSKFASKPMAVGSKYLEGTALSCRKGYEKDLKLKMAEGLK